MYEPNESRVLERIGPEDVVLDIGGWARPFNRANFVIDAEPFSTRGYYGPSRPAQGGVDERFDFTTWIQRDMCSREPFPFADKEIDFCVCSHTLEDIRDPLWVCSEIIRVAKRGYLEVPSRLAESCRGWESRRVAGLSHHRWLVEMESGAVEFLQKYHMIHSGNRFSFPPGRFRSLAEDEKVQWLFWEKSFEYRERTIHGLDNIAQELSSYITRRSESFSRLSDIASLFPEWANTTVTRLRALL